MSEVKIMVSKMPSSGKECPFSVFDCEWGRRCSIDKEHLGMCSIDCGYECEYLADPFTPINYNIDFDKLADKMARTNVLSKEDVEKALKRRER